MTATHAEANPLTDDAVRPFARAEPRGRRLCRRQGRKPRRARLRGTAGARRLRRRRPGIRGVSASQTGLRERLAELLDGVDVEDTAALQAASAAAREMVDQTPMPAPLAHEIGVAYERLAA